MAIDSVSSTSESVPNQELVSVTRENDGSVSFPVHVSATDSAAGESSTQAATGAEQAKNDMDGTDTDYPTEQTGQDDTANTYDEALVTAMEDLQVKINEIIELLGGQSGDSTADDSQPVDSGTPVDTSQISVTDQEDGLIPLLGGDLISLFNRMDSEGQNEFIALLESGELGEDGVKMAEILQDPALQNDEQSEEYISAYNEHAKLLLDQEFSGEISMALNSIYKEHQMTGDPSADPVLETDEDS
jgi:hypothetical protein